ncbi:DUF3833 family protein [Roseomonas sp. BN140053]|uniref:DUF3833 family protein n=1 Tax=Roseomonas sp. BN140053 TaxID=3391898 RepID=UPI0039EB2C38
MRRRALLLGAAALPLAGCGSISAQTFAGHGPPFRPEEFFSGRLRSQGLFVTRLGALDSWFTAELDGSWDGTMLRFHEVFHYENGFVDRRSWELRRDAPDRWRGTATDAVGEVTATESGNGFHLLHTLDMPRPGGGTRRLSFDQWFVRLDETNALSRAAVSFHGLQVGTAQVSFRKLA